MNNNKYVDTFTETTLLFRTGLDIELWKAILRRYKESPNARSLGSIIIDLFINT